MKFNQNKKITTKYKTVIINSVSLVKLRDNLKRYERLNI